MDIFICFLVIYNLTKYFKTMCCTYKFVDGRDVCGN